MFSQELIFLCFFRRFGEVLSFESRILSSELLGELVVHICASSVTGNLSVLLQKRHEVSSLHGRMQCCMKS